MAWAARLAVLVLVLALGQVRAYTVPDAEYSGLEVFYNSLSGASWSSDVHWFEKAENPDDPCSWTGLECSETPGADGFVHITTISLASKGLDGEFPSDFSFKNTFSYLETLDCSRNNMRGRIPEFPSTLTALSVRYNSLTKLPINMCELKKLEYCHLDFNEINDQLPDCFGGLSSLKVFGVTRNHMCGYIPSDMSGLKELKTFILSGNNMEGAIPDSLLHLDKIETVDLTGNRFTGKVYSVGSSLMELDLGGTMATGVLSEIANSSGDSTVNLLYLDVSSTNVCGILSDVVSYLYEGKTLNNLRLLALDNSQLTAVQPIPLVDELRESGSGIQRLSVDGAPVFCGDSGANPLEDGTLSNCIQVKITSVSHVNEDEPKFTRLEVALLHYPYDAGYDFISMLKLSKLQCSKKIGDDHKLYNATYYGNNIEGLVICHGFVAEDEENNVLDPRNIDLYLDSKKITSETKLETRSWKEIKTEPQKQQTSASDVEYVIDDDPMPKVIVSVAGMSKCPDFAKFMADIIVPSYSEIQELNANADPDTPAVGIEIVFMTEKMESYITGIWSMHGQLEVLGNSGFECMYKFGGTDKVVELSKCLYMREQEEEEVYDDTGVSRIPVSLEECFAQIAGAEGTEYTADDLVKCTYNDGFAMVQDDIERITTLGAVWSPTVYINGVQKCLYNDPDPSLCEFSSADEFMELVKEALQE